MARLVLILGLLGVAAAQEAQYDRWIEQLGSADAAKRETARRVLLNAGTRALGEVDRAGEAATDGATRERLIALAKEIRQREPHGLQFQCGMPKMRLTVDVVNGEEFQFAVRVRNLGAKPVVLHPFLALRVLDAAGKELKLARRLGRHGLRPDGCLLETVSFVTLQPGETWSFTDGLRRYMHDPEWILGWEIPAPGTYTLEFTYRFARAAFKKTCSCGAAAHDDKGKPWNDALELDHTFTAEMEVK